MIMRLRPSAVWAPSPLVGEGWGGGYSRTHEDVAYPPPGALRAPTSPTRGEVSESPCVPRKPPSSSPVRRVERDVLGDLAFPAVAVRKETLLVVVEFLAGLGR